MRVYFICLQVDGPINRVVWIDGGGGGTYNRKLTVPLRLTVMLVVFLNCVFWQELFNRILIFTKKVNIFKLLQQG